MKNIFCYNYPIGKIWVCETDGFITQILFNTESSGGFDFCETPVIKEAALQLNEYFGGKRVSFKLPLNLQGTEFQKTVWQALQTVPAGETRSYKDIAVQINKAKAYRAVGSANNKNPVPIIVPCHRVIGGKKDLTGYAWGIGVKKYLLDLEKRYYKV